jgi:hypothetical protein
MTGYKLPIQDIWQNVYDPSTETIKTSGGAVPTSIFSYNYGYDGAVWQRIGTALVGSRYALDVNVVAGGATPTPPITLYSNTVPVPTAGTPVAIAGSVSIKRITLKAYGTNTGKIYVGDSTTQYLELEAGESIDINIDNLSKVWIDADVNAEGVTYIAEY